jgi:hypothetical protein
MDDFEHVQTEIQASIDSQTSIMYDCFGHFKINLDALLLQRFMFRGGDGCPGMSPCFSHFVLSFSSYLVTCLVTCTVVVIMSTSMDCFH